MLETQNQTQAEEQKTDKLVGTVEKILFKNQDNGYHVLNVEMEVLKDITVTLNHPNIFEGFTYEFIGEYTTHPKFGKQFKANSAQEILPSTIEGLKSYLASSFFPGIGPVIANRVINHFGENVIEVFNNDIEKLLTVPGISQRKLEAIKDSWEKNKEVNDVMMFLKQHGISTLYAKKIYEFYGKNCVSQIISNPYKLCRDISGIGFLYADKVALQIGFDSVGLNRIQACIYYILEQGSSDGHCYLYENQIVTKSTELLKVDLKDKVSESLNTLDRLDEIKTVLADGDKNKRYYSRKLYYNEKYCAEKIHLLKDNTAKVQVHESLFENIKDEIELSPEQKQAVLGVIGKGVSVLTGGPGAGKTTTTKKLVRLLLKLGFEVALAAPTGRASQRMTEVIGYQASTIHRLLVWDHESKSFLKNESNTIQADFIVIDESSMVDINLAAALLKATPSNAQILFIGDSDQLPPVGPGDFFRDLIASNIVPVFRLNKIFRQGKESLIIQYAYDINSQKMPTIDTPLMNPELWKNGTDCLFIDSGVHEPHKPKNEYPKWSSLRYDLDFVNMITKLYTESIPKYIGKDKEIQILMPMNIGEFGTIKVNQVIQSIVNPPKDNKHEIKIKERILRDGDKVIQTKNNYDLEVFNGDIGKVISIDKEKTEIIVKFSEDREVLYSKSDILELDLAYAISIHKSQGSEFDCVILPIMMAHYRMLYKQLIYTGLTRAKKFAVFVGQRKALEVAVKNSNAQIRQTSLKTMLLDENLVSPI